MDMKRFQIDASFGIELFRHYEATDEQAEALQEEVEQKIGATGLVAVVVGDSFDGFGPDFNLYFDADVKTPDKRIVKAFAKFIQLEDDLKDDPVSTISLIEPMYRLDCWFTDECRMGNPDDEFILEHIHSFPRIALDALLYEPEPKCSVNECQTHKCKKEGHSCHRLEGSTADMRERMEHWFEAWVGPFFDEISPDRKERYVRRPDHISAVDLKVVEDYLFGDFVTCKLQSCYEAIVDVDLSDQQIKSKAERLAAAAEVVSRIN
jgi:hypothetical protein